MFCTTMRNPYGGTGKAPSASHEAWPKKTDFLFLPFLVPGVGESLPVPVRLPFLFLNLFPGSFIGQLLAPR